MNPNGRKSCRIPVHDSGILSGTGWSTCPDTYVTYQAMEQSPLIASLPNPIRYPWSLTGLILRKHDLPSCLAPTSKPSDKLDCHVTQKCGKRAGTCSSSMSQHAKHEDKMYMVLSARQHCKESNDQQEECVEVLRSYTGYQASK